MEELIKQYTKNLINASYDDGYESLNFPPMVVNKQVGEIYIYGNELEITKDCYYFILEVIEKIKNKENLCSNGVYIINNKTYTKNGFSKKINAFNEKVKNKIIYLNQEGCKYPTKKFIAHNRNKDCYLFCKDIEIIII